MDVPSGREACHGIKQVVGRGGSWRQRKLPSAEQFLGHVNIGVLQNANSFGTAQEGLFIVQHGPAAVQLRERHFRVRFMDVLLLTPVHDDVDFVNLVHDVECLYWNPGVQLFEVDAAGFREAFAFA